MNYLNTYYETHDEDNRFSSKHGRIEYLTTRKYIDEYLAGDLSKRIIEIGAGTGNYSVPLAKEGYAVTAVELVERNISVLKSKLDGSENIEVSQGNALDLSRFECDLFDLTLCLGPMYHLYSNADKLTALSEAVRVTKPAGIIMVAYCMNEATVIQYVFGAGFLNDVIESDLLTPDWHCKSEPSEVFELIRTEEIAELDSHFGVTRLKLIASDGAAHYLRALIDGMDDFTYEKWLDYHFSTCERQDLIGASNHTLDIIRKN
jgi:2-polyprenyl-3-methyl-5-hydroxy-6-metoxy-1,4-benzoquinol methylase